MQKQNFLSLVPRFVPWPEIGKLYWKKKKNAKHLLIGLTIHKLTERKKVVQMSNKPSSCSSYNEIGLQNKSWVCPSRDKVVVTTLLRRRYTLSL